MSPFACGRCLHPWEGKIPNDGETIICEHCNNHYTKGQPCRYPFVITTAKPIRIPAMENANVEKTLEERQEEVRTAISPPAICATCGKPFQRKPGAGRWRERQYCYNPECAKKAKYQRKDNDRKARKVSAEPLDRQNVDGATGPKDIGTIIKEVMTEIRADYEGKIRKLQSEMERDLAALERVAVILGGPK